MGRALLSLKMRAFRLGFVLVEQHKHSRHDALGSGHRTDRQMHTHTHTHVDTQTCTHTHTHTHRHKDHTHILMN
jgi:hypothetical protein